VLIYREKRQSEHLNQPDGDREKTDCLEKMNAYSSVKEGRTRQAKGLRYPTGIMEWSKKGCWSTKILPEFRKQRGGGSFSD